MLRAGDALGPYEVTGPLGAGGMGEVYRAHDRRLGRDVAIKVLPAPAIGNADRRARFEREAQVLASLNHPHIAAVYGLEHGDGFDALVLELVEGPTLADRIAAGPFEADAAIDVARQMAEALEAAHEKNIVHRDLKPANVKLDVDGRVKVLDFGLAKALDPAASLDLANSPTLTGVAMTAAGLLLGTAAYMAPEQARGSVVDKRADIWAFGVVVFEMLIGGRLFEGETVSDTLAAVLRQDIDWNRLPSGTPPPVSTLLRRCLERDPKRRLRDIGEARIALDAAGLQAVAASTASGVATTPSRAHARFRAIDVLSLLLLVALVAITTAWWRTPTAPTEPIRRLTIPLPIGASFDLVNRPVLALSRDGSALALVLRNGNVTQLYVRRLADFEPQVLAGTEGASGPFFSPDGSWIAFFAEGKLKKIPATGGPIILLADAIDPRGGVWTDRDTIIATLNNNTALVELPAAGGPARAVTTLDEGKSERTHRWPALLPDQRTVLFTVGSVEHPDDYDDATIEAVRIDTGERRVILRGGRAPQFTPSGHLIYMRGKVVYSVPFDVRRLQALGNATPVADGVSGDATTGAAHYAISDQGVFAYVPGDPSAVARLLAILDAHAQGADVDVRAALFTDPHPSPDGRRIAVGIIDATNSSRDIWLVDTVRGTTSRLTLGGNARTPIWAPDGRNLFFMAYDAGSNTSTVMTRASDGSGRDTAIQQLKGQAYIDDLSPDGTTLVIWTSGVREQGRTTMYRMPARGGEPVMLVESPGNVVQGAVSPDGRWLAYNSDESGRPEIYVQSFPSGGSRSQVSTEGGREPHWASRGRSLVYLQNSELVQVPIEPGPTFVVAGKPTVLIKGIVNVQLATRQTYHVMPDGAHFVITRPPDDRSVTPDVRLTLNWFADLKR